MKYKINNIFRSIQGEGSYIGSIVQFIRFSGCNKKCSFCDTDHERFDEVTIGQILLLLRPEVKIIVMTGGEPLLQIDEDLLIALKNRGHELHLETNGSLKLGRLKTYFKHISVSPKQPFYETKIERIDDLKVVYPCTIEEEWRGLKCNKFLQPLDENGPFGNNNLSKTIYKCYELGWKLSPQLHKLIGVE